MSSSESIRPLLENVARVLVGKREVIKQAASCLLCRGHLLIEDVPGVGKTMLARALSLSIDAEYKRVQFTPDLLPLDVTGSNVFNQQTSTFYFRAGPVFTNILLADEINRASPRTQASLLECMEERQVTLEGTTHPLPEPFVVIATQNPIELQGTYPLPEAQIDRFFMKVNLGYVDLGQEVAMLKAQTKAHPIDGLKPVVSIDDVLSLQERVTDVHVDESLLRYVAQIVRATREHPEVQLGASPRGSLSLRRASQALALVDGEEFVTPGMIKTMAYPVLRHRLLLKPQSRLTGVTADSVVKEVLEQVEVPIR